MKARFALLASSACLLVGSACSDMTSTRPTLSGSSALIIVPTGTLDQNIMQILALYPKGLETAATTRWGNVKSKYAAGLADPAQLAVAKQMAFELSDWVNKKAPDMDTPPNGETKVSASARAVQYMLMYIYDGPTTAVPSYSPAADAIVGLVTPGAPATIVTPTAHAGVQFEAGSVAENTVIVISQNLTPFTENCSGPLQTLLCQYPQFYNFDQFPHKRLLKGAKFAVCHVNDPENPRHPLADHDRFRLAHAKPANPADYTPGSTIRDQNGESIEILPFVRQTFVTCPEETVEASNSLDGAGVLTRLARTVKKALTPKTAYAIDQGGGGVSWFFSPFNDVDPDGRPDRAVQSLTVSPVCGLLECVGGIHPGSHLNVHYEVANIGTAATGDGVPGIIKLVQPAIEGPPFVTLLGSFGVAQVVPGGATVFNQEVVLPFTLLAGDYTIEVTSGIGFFPEVPADLTNNTAAAPVHVTVDLVGLLHDANDASAIAYYGNGLAPTAEGQITLSALFSDEFLNAETFPTRIQVDQRSILADNVTMRNAFRDAQRARAKLDYAAMQWGHLAPLSPGHGDLISFSGFADVVLAENWCSGVPTSAISATGTVVYGAQQTTTQLLQSAIQKFDNAIAIGNAIGESGITTVNAARIGKARALLDLNDFARASAAASGIPTAFSYAVGANDVQNNGVYQFQNFQLRWTVSDNEGGNGLPYRSDDDPRIRFESRGRGFDAVTPVFAQLKYPGAASPAPFAQGIEARLIEAEAAMRTGNLASFLANLNAARVFQGLPAIAIAPETDAERRDLLFKERAYGLWLTSHRLGDLRRLVRHYGLTQSSVFPTGEYPKGGTYGSDVNFPIPVDTQFNPTGMACLDRNP